MQFEGGYVFISIDGKSLDTLTQISISKIQIIESIKATMPTLEIEMAINETENGAPTVHEGSKIVVSIVTESLKKDFAFRVFYYGTSSEKGAETLFISAYFDCPDFFKITSRKVYKGPSSEVARILAQDSKLEFIGDSTKDAQTWIRDGSTGSAFLEKVKRHAFIDDLSCIASGIRKSGALVYKNLTPLMKNKENWIFTDLQLAEEKGQNYVFFFDHVYKDASGTMNKWKGYGGYAQNFDVLTSEFNTVTIDKVKKHNKYLSLSQDIKPSFVEVGPLNCGNTHENYFKAKVQNEKNLALFSSELKVYGTNLTEITIFDLAVVAYSHDHMSTLTPSISGKYLVAGVTLQITPTEGVVTEYTLCRQGFNPSNNQTVSGVV